MYSDLLYVLPRGVLSRYVRARARYAHTWKRLLRTVDFHLGCTASEKREDGRGLGMPGGGAALAKIIC